MGEEIITTSMIMGYIDESLIKSFGHSFTDSETLELRSKLGFSNNIDSDFSEAKDFSDYRILSHAQWGSVLSKYNLVEGRFEAYIHPIPKDVLLDLDRILNSDSKLGSSWMVVRDLNNGELDKASFMFSNREIAKKRLKDFVIENFLFNITPELIRPLLFNGSKYEIREFKSSIIDSYTIRIAAPNSHFDFKRKTSEPMNYDPIVVIKMATCVVILKAWDVEAYIPEIVDNHLMN